VSEYRQRLAAARARAHEVTGIGPTLIRHTSHAVVFTLTRRDEERQAALEYVLGQERFADEIDPEFGPLYLGWALFQAFLAGVDWARQE